MKEDASAGPVAAFEGVSVRLGKTLALDRVSFSVDRGCVYALLGCEGSGKSTAIDCLLGRRKPSSGVAYLFGRNSRKSGRAIRARTGIVPKSPNASTGRLANLFSKRKEGAVVLGRALSHLPELLVLDDPEASLDAATLRTLYAEVIPELKGRSATVFLTTRDPAGIEGVADRVGVLKEGRLLIDERLDSLKSRFRKIAYKNEITESRTDYGSELDDFDAVRVRVRGWGVEAVVGDFSEAKFENFRVQDGIIDAIVSTMSLEEIFIAVAGETKIERPGRGSSRR